MEQILEKAQNEQNIIRDYVRTAVRKHYNSFYLAADSAYFDSVQMVENLLSSDLDSCISMDLYLRKANSKLSEFGEVLVLNGIDLTKSEINNVCDSINFTLEDCGYTSIKADYFVSNAEDFISQIPNVIELLHRHSLHKNQQMFHHSILQLKYRISTIESHINTLSVLSESLNLFLTKAIVMKFVCIYKLQNKSNDILADETNTEILNAKLKMLNELILRLELSQKSFSNLADLMRISLSFVYAQEQAESTLKTKVLLT